MLVKWEVKPGPGRAGPGISKLKTVFFFHQKYMFMLTDIHIHDSVHLNLYSLIISTLNILVNTLYHRLLFYRMVLDEIGNKLKPGFDIFVF